MGKFSDHQAARRGCDKQEVQCLHSVFKKNKPKQQQHQKTETEIILVHG